MSKKKIILTSIMFSIVMVIVTIVFLSLSFPKKEEDVVSPVTPIEEDETMESLDLTLIEGATTVEEGQISADDYIYRVYVSNPEELYNSSLPSHGYGTFEGYLSRYINYYVPGDERYEVQFITGSDDFYAACTDFLVRIPDLDITVRCIYINSLKRYDFKSPLSEDN